MFRKGIIAWAIILATVGQISAQSSQSENEMDTWKSKIFLGGHASLQYGRFTDIFEVSPALGYYIQPQWVAGAGLVYAYHAYAMETQDGLLTSEDNYYGASLFTRYYFKSEKYKFLNKLYAHGEYEFLLGQFNLVEDNQSFMQTHRHKTPIVALGYKQNLGTRTALNFTLGVALGPKDKIPYRNPIIRIGLEF